MPGKIKRLGIALSLLLIVGAALGVVQLFQKAARVPSSAAANMHQKHPVDQQVRLLLVGDLGSPNEKLRQVSQAMEARCSNDKPDALVFLGDNIYPNGVSSVNDERWQTNLLSFFQGPCLGDVKIYAILGNHDYRGNAQAQVDFTNANDRWVMPYRYYDVQFDDLLSITAIDSWYSDYCFFTHNCMTNFMQDSLSRNKDKAWKISIGHYPFNSISSKRHGNHNGSWTGKLLERLLCSGNNDIYFAGHSHHLEHRSSAACEMDLVIAGGGGGGNEHDIDETRIEEAQFAATGQGFTELVADQQHLSVDYFNGKGDKLYGFTRNHAALD